MAGVHMGAIGGGGGTFSGGGSTSGANSTLSKEDNLVLSSEVSSNPNGSELDLGLGLSLGGGGAGSTGGGMKAQQTVSQGQYARFLTAEDFPSVISQGPCSASSSSSSYLNRDNASAGTKRSADSVASGNGIRYYPNDLFFFFFNFLQPFVFLFIFVSLFRLYVNFYYFCDIMVVPHFKFVTFCSLN